MSIKNNTVGTTEITPVETEVTRSEKQESRDFSRGRFKDLYERDKTENKTIPTDICSLRRMFFNLDTGKEFNK